MKRINQTTSHGLGFVPAPLAKLPWRVLFLLLAIGGFGLVVLFSAAGGSVQPWASRQGLAFAIFLLAAIGISRIRMSFWQGIALPAYAVITVMLVLVELVGAVKGGSQRWLDLGFIRVQPSEFMKPAIVLALARFYDLLPAGEIRRFGAVWPAAAMLGIPVVLVMLQPDLGTALMITAGGLTVMFLAGLPLRLFVGGALGVAIAAPLAFNFLLHEYQKNRVLIFLNPESDPLGTGYHISQSKIAIGSGGIFGKGFLNGTQSHLDYLPEGHTDFVFATMAEEWGLVGGVLLITAFILLVRWGVGVGVRAEGRFSKLVAGGLATTIFFYVAINLGMVMGLAPVVGIPLPLVSYGGSAQMTVLGCIGILMAIDRENRDRVRF
ncbi:MULTISPECIES: rod shape-determining protein RodA [Sphingomonas]|jgi:rod shape determining protein RodA|uniref:Peptidoglycan glycosyltransferase MrdB n=1 Tax=Sphingomonas hankookensis TaxID=563996 RepID=A0ABR5YGS2_9SPHN|nr:MULTISPECIES: rod shape-determining protein RodA [Sphingomonas]KZE18869.1 rod shape-determining protein RodA [Sphingomonas hankookensis]PZT93777.1 MAG: rod shape-determining protein RodA [Sphingomonas sp.]RSV32436.1 rod shape-determining protein RodA [Sphingomonas sp. ABOLH]WCP70779.1 rod shape-determining protein RodA [Sphingomonas hankookensis]